ncbi:hypothetical protein TALC_01475 [Thermoplasmatales archaeon BRNA1]|nr:hypothetical protein TALC_01475 [Thermoplasmatales archaeon BRNA1]
MRLAVTGGTWGKDGIRRLFDDPVIKGFDKGDFLVILGDCGITEPRANLRERIDDYRRLPCSVLFIDGSRDDYDLLGDYPLFPWNGGMMQNISRSILRLTRGQVFMICGAKVLTLGGASTPERGDLGKYWNWWPEQDPSPGDVDTAVLNTAEWGGHVDFILTCDCPTSWKGLVGGRISKSSDVLEDLLRRVDYRHWYFGNHPIDADYDDVRASCVNKRVIRIV